MWRWTMKYGPVSLLLIWVEGTYIWAKKATEK